MGLGDTALYGLEILELKFVIDNLLVAHGINRAVDMGDIVVVEAAEHMYDGIGLADVGQELVAQALALGSTLYQTGNIDNLDRGGHHALGLTHLHEFGQAVVGHGDYAHIRLNGTEWKVGRLSLSV